MAVLVPRVRWLESCASGVALAPPAGAPFALAAAVLVEEVLLTAISSTVPGVVKLLAVVALTVCSEMPRASDAPIAAFVPFASPVALVATGDDRSVARAAKSPVSVSVTALPT